MIIIKNGEIQKCETSDVIYKDADENANTIDNWYDYPLQNDVCILQIPKNSKELKLFEVYGGDLQYIPRVSETDYEFHDVFWNSNETYVFESYQYALNFMSNYDGDFKTEISELNKRLAESQLVDETIRQFSNLDDLAQQFDVDFMNELEDIVYSMDINMDSVLNSMKLFILDKYRSRLEEQRLSRLN